MTCPSFESTKLYLSENGTCLTIKSSEIDAVINQHSRAVRYAIAIKTKLVAIKSTFRNIWLTLPLDYHRML